MPTGAENLDDVYAALKQLLEKHARGLEALDKIPGSTAKGDKPGYHLVGKREVSILGRKPQRTYVVGIIRHPKSVGFYSMPLYTHPSDCPISPALEKLRSGKSCLQIKTSAPGVLKELDAHLKQGIAAYKREGWV
jgi:hypothetical protein